jgi:uncharacterized membrane protein YeaQ/YmgE (transglycosylase-associated protein family)
MDLIVTLVIGGIVGFLASLVMRTHAQMGILANVVVGIAGSMLGPWLVRLLGLGARSPAGNWVVSILGAMALIVVLKGLRVYR